MPTTTPTAAVAPTPFPSSVNTNALWSAQKAGAELGIDPTTLYSQFVLETGNFKLMRGTNNFGNIRAGTGFAKYDTPDEFVTAFVHNIKSVFPAAQNTGSNITAYVSGLTNNIGEIYYSESKDPTAKGYVSPKTYANSIIGVLAGVGTSLGNQPANLSISEQNSVNTANVGAPLTFAQKANDVIAKADASGQTAVSAVGNALDPSTWLAPIESWLNKAVHPIVMFIVGVLLVVFGLIVIFKTQIETITEVAAPESIPAVEAEKKLTKGKGK